MLSGGECLPGIPETGGGYRVRERGGRGGDGCRGRPDAAGAGGAALPGGVDQVPGVREECRQIRRVRGETVPGRADPGRGLRRRADRPQQHAEFREPGVRPDRRPGRGHRHRQLLGLAHGPGLPARRPRGERPRTAQHPQGHRRQPKLRSHPAVRGPQAAARPRPGQAGGGRDVPVLVRQGCEGATRFRGAVEGVRGGRPRPGPDRPPGPARR
jgi:hypothetical protein